ncbi:DUF3634 family protein [Vibrio europaeus]|jgi:hypothetical protein|uniref:DUF3634 domain-containing protein n=3 Tax=Vibrio oreintalis group TaxID=1891919 RepID=F9T1C8_9VIBR|nr:MULTISPECIES: DUF3634 family protein [Vibrio oreintalis group]AIW14041.1 hypothetical protein IX91_07475 [Vibrio tubiashii ATCC 19109]EGU58309.1 hypothetical protein VITU9109_19235 [Vibrio tubiashii ATCC 19109]EIF03177.1 hypothetical protein VT1337_14939 [Vibrio tubiashii NCIMB 1337 = ATCC 19106]MCG9576375.1 DUF3634 family protein [Vibrio tubiashii]MDC5706384.1 DUF3634 family protein [Vibrio europaeus]
MLYVILIASIVIFWLVAVDRPVLKVTFSDGKITREKGHFPPSFKHNVVEIAERTPFSGELKVYQQRTGTKLVMSKQVPKKVQQRIRNVFPHQGFRSKGKKHTG